MSTGARPDQIEAAAYQYLQTCGPVGDDTLAEAIDIVTDMLDVVVLPGSAIIDAEDVAAIRRAAELIELVRDSVDEYEDAGIMFACSAAELLDEFHRIMPSSPADLDRLRKIGDTE